MNSGNPVKLKVIMMMGQEEAREEMVIGRKYGKLEESMASASLNHWTTREVPPTGLKIKPKSLNSIPPTSLVFSLLGTKSTSRFTFPSLCTGYSVYNALSNPLSRHTLILSFRTEFRRHLPGRLPWPHHGADTRLRCSTGLRTLAQYLTLHSKWSFFLN